MSARRCRGCAALAAVLAVHATAGLAAGSRVAGYRPAAASAVILEGVPAAVHSASPGERSLARADALQYTHRYEEAQRELDRRLAASPMDVRARLMRSQLRIALGDARGALADCTVAAPRLDALTATACSVQARAALDVRGQLRDELRREIARAIAGAGPGSGSLAWAAGIAADLAEGDGDLAAAGQWHRRAVANAGGAHYPAVAYAGFLERRVAQPAARSNAPRAAGELPGELQ